LAEHVGRKLLGQADDRSPVAAFVERMNSAAAELGMASSRFANPHGLTEEHHQASAADLFRLAVALLAREDFRTIANTPEYACLLSSEAGYVRPVRWRNTNRLLGLEGYSGLKTGTTSAAGACLVSCGARDGEERVVIVLGSSCSEARYADTLNLYRWSWQRWPPGKTD
jgi:D-alanyl-D-alanine carboxypeptidase (penicillin-binding protein 5/6)